MKESYANFQAMDSKDKNNFIKETLLNNLLYILILIAIIFTAIKNPKFMSVSAVATIVTLSAASIPIALGIAGCIVLTGTDLSAGRVVGLTACITAAGFRLSE